MAKKKKTTAAKPRRKRRKGRIKKGTYQGMKLDSGWELSCVLYWHDHGIPFERNVTQKFPYVYRKKTYNYIPDFIVDGQWVEVKGKEDQRTVAKFKYFPHPLTILRRAEMKPILDYVIRKYGKNFYDLYE